MVRWTRTIRWFLFARTTILGTMTKITTSVTSDIFVWVRGTRGRGVKSVTAYIAWFAWLIVPRMRWMGRRGRRCSRHLLRWVIVWMIVLVILLLIREECSWVRLGEWECMSFLLFTDECSDEVSECNRVCSVSEWKCGCNILIVVRARKTIKKKLLLACIWDCFALRF